MKLFMLLNYTVYLSPDEILEPFFELNCDSNMENNDYSKYRTIRLPEIDQSNLKIFFKGHTGKARFWTHGLDA